MGKIAIVGVKGSGKTVLMAALGEKYQVADPFGLVLAPESPDAFGFVRVNMAKMRGGEWPMETPHDSVRAMRWSLQRERADGPNEVFCDLDFLDFGGEIYTEAFGSGPKANSGMWESECAALKAHIGESQMLVVLVNLRDVVSGATDPDTLTALWVTKGMLDYASRDLKLANLAIAFTQVDAYRDVIAASGGLKAVLRKCMPHVYSSYRDLPLFALSAVDRTVEGKDGLPRPAPGFGSQGLDDLVHWILGCTEKGRACADEIAAAKARPHDLWREIVAGMEALRTDAVQPAGLTTAERCAKIAGLQTAAAELAVSALRHDVPDFTDEGLVERRTELGSWAKLAGLAGEYVRAAAAKDAGLASRLEAGLVAEAAAWPHLLARAREESRQVSAARKSRFRARALGVAALLVSAILGIGVAAARHNAAVDRLVAEKGYSCESSFGIRNAVWKAGVRHPTCPDLKASNIPETWVCTREGWRWDGKNGVFARNDGKVTALVKGINMTFTITNGLAIVGGGNSDEPAVPTDTVGKVEIPGTIDGCAVRSIAHGAFYKCTGVRAVVIPPSVTSIGSWAFSHCASLTSVTIPASVKNVGSVAFSDCGSLASVTLQQGVESIGYLAFYDCTSLTSVTIPSSVTNIEWSAFKGCEDLKSVTMQEGVANIGGFVFTGCKSLTAVTIPSSVANIGDFAFAGCKSLTRATLQQGVESIREGAFDDCASLVSVTIPSSVTSVGKGAFNGCNVQTVYSDDPERVKRLFGGLLGGANFVKGE